MQILGNELKREFAGQGLALSRCSSCSAERTGKDVQSKGRLTLRAAVALLEEGTRQVYPLRSVQMTNAESKSGNPDAKW